MNADIIHEPFPFNFAIVVLIAEVAREGIYEGASQNSHWHNDWTFLAEK